MKLVVNDLVAQNEGRLEEELDPKKGVRFVLDDDGVSIVVSEQNGSVEVYFKEGRFGKRLAITPRVSNVIVLEAIDR